LRVTRITELSVFDTIVPAAVDSLDNHNTYSTSAHLQHVPMKRRETNGKKLL